MMASAKDTATFFTHGTHLQYEHVLKLYPQALKLKAEQKAKKPEELVKLDNWYQNELPKKIKSRGKDAHMLHEELVQTMKWKQTRGKYYPQLSYLVKVNTPRAVMAETRKAFRKLPNLEQAITALSNLKGVGTTMASALLAAACPESAPFMADECLLAIPDIEGIDYTTKEYLKFVNHIQAVAERLNKSAKESNRNDSVVWSPHKVELALWTHYVVSDIKPELLSGVFAENGNSIPPAIVHQNGDSFDTSSTSEESNQGLLSNGKSTNNNNNNNNNKTSGTTTTTTTTVIDEDTNTSFASSPQSIEDETNDSVVSDSTNDSTTKVLLSDYKRPLNHGDHDNDDDSNSLETPCKKLKDEIGDK